jgi:hypothetical protein
MTMRARRPRKDARGKTTTYGYDNAGRRTLAKVPLGDGTFAEAFTPTTRTGIRRPGGRQSANDHFEYNDQNERTKTIFPV